MITATKKMTIQTTNRLTFRGCADGITGGFTKKAPDISLSFAQAVNDAEIWFLRNATDTLFKQLDLEQPNSDSTARLREVAAKVFQSCDSFANAQPTSRLFRDASAHQDQRKMIRRLRKTIDKFSWECRSCRTKNTVIDDSNPFRLRETCPVPICGCHRDGEPIQVGQPFWKKLGKVHVLASRICRAWCTGDEQGPAQDQSENPETADHSIPTLPDDGGADEHRTLTPPKIPDGGTWL